MADLTALARLFSLEGKTAIITGATSGIGKAVAELFLTAGATLVVSGNTQGKLDSLIGHLRARAAAGQTIEGQTADLSEEAQVLSLFALADKALGKLDILVNSAGIFQSVPFMDLDVAFWDRVQAVNGRGAYLTNREAVKRMRGRGGSIVNVSSVSGQRITVSGHAQYGASKAGVNMLTQTLAYEYGAENIRVNAVLPGGVDTEGVQEAVKRYASMPSEQMPFGPTMQPGRVPLGRLGNPAEIANLCLFLASPAASYITGQLIAADGGFQLS